MDGVKPQVPATGTPPRVVPGLTVLYHPDLRRVGERLPLPGLPLGESALVSRREPIFETVRGEPTRPLEDPFLSRRHLRLSRSGRGYAIDVPAGMALKLQGTVIEGQTHVSDEELGSGVVLELARRVVLLLHTFTVGWARPEPMGLVGDSDALDHVREQIAAAAAEDGPLLLMGEPGSGKELVARAIHLASARARGPWSALTMAAIPPDGVLGELFGAPRGSEAGPAAREGELWRARGGTLFLDGVCELPPAAQAALLELLQTGATSLPGGEPTRLDVRLIAATESDLDRESAAGRFDPRLQDALSRRIIKLPPLRLRRDDVGRLTVHFLRQELTVYGEQSRLAPRPPDESLWFPAALMARLAAASWPGNVRQLRNVIRQLVMASRGQPELTLTPSVERALCEGDRRVGPTTSDTVEMDDPPELPAPRQLSDEELVEVLRAHRWRNGPTASALGLTRDELAARMDRCPLIRKPAELDFDEVVSALVGAGGSVDLAADRLQVSSRGLRQRLAELGLS